MRRIGGTTFLVVALVFLASAIAFGASVVNAVRVGEVPASSTDGSGDLVGPGSETDSDAASPSMMRDDPREDSTPADSTPRPREAPSDSSLRYAEAPGSDPRANSYPRVSNDELLEAVNRDVFQPDRTPPLGRYLLPSQREASAPEPRNNRRRREPELLIVGTAIAGDLALAMVQPDDSIPFAVLLGESVDGFFLAAIDEDSVTLTRDGEEFVYPVTEPQRGGSSSNRARNARNRAATEEAAQAMAERVQQMLRQLQQRGGGVVQERPVQMRFTPGVDLIQRGGQTGRAGTVTVRPRSGGGSGGGGNRP
jgi:hypothetical protein